MANSRRSRRRVNAKVERENLQRLKEDEAKPERVSKILSYMLASLYVLWLLLIIFDVRRH